MRRLLPLPMLLLLAGCHGASLATQWKLREFKIADADLTQLRIAARGPEWMTITPEKAAIDVTIHAGDDKQDAGGASLHLHKVAHAADRLDLPQLSAGSLTVLELDSKSLEAARRLQQETQRLKARGLKVVGKLHVNGALACRRDRDAPQGPIPIDVLVHPSDELGWLPFYDQYDLRRDELSGEKFDEALPQCTEAPKPR